MCGSWAESRGGKLHRRKTTAGMQECRNAGMNVKELLRASTAPPVQFRRSHSRWGYAVIRPIRCIRVIRAPTCRCHNARGARSKSSRSGLAVCGNRGCIAQRRASTTKDNCRNARMQECRNEREGVAPSIDSAACAVPPFTLQTGLRRHPTDPMHPRKPRTNP